MIVFEPLGGLGNQIFTYAAGLANATRLNTELHADLWNLVDYDWHSYELNSFENSISREFVGRKKSANLPAPMTKLREKVGFGNWSSKHKLYEEKDNQFSPKFLSVENGSRLRGYFQSWKYVEPVSDILHRQLLSLKNPSKWFEEKSSELESMKPWIGIHVRLGNYQGLPAMGVTADVYYRRAIRLLKDLGCENNILVFSDSPELIKNREIFDRDTNWALVETSSSSRPLETLLLMAKSSHLVIANSTFSWWAAWMGRKDVTRRVIYPRPWINLKSWDDRDMPFPGWLGLSREEVRTKSDDGEEF